MPRRIVDTHIHIWDFDKAEYAWLKGNTSILNKNYHLTELEEERKRSGITDGILIQAANNAEDTDLMLQVAEENDWIKGVVGWVPLINPSTTETQLNKKYGDQEYLKGIRHLIHDEPDTKWLLQKQVLESLNILAVHDLAYDVVGVLPDHIETALAVAAKLPALRMAFDHLNQPPIATKEQFGKWGELMKEAAGHPKFYAKISGIGLTAQNPNWNANDIKPYIAFVFEHFGVDRCFCGGDWPVALLAGSYSYTWKIYREVIDSLLSERDREKVYYSNAVAFYRL